MKELGFHECMGRVGGIALSDVVATCAASYVVAKHMGWDILRTTFAAFAIGEVAHVALGIKTPVSIHIM